MRLLSKLNVSICFILGIGCAPVPTQIDDIAPISTVQNGVFSGTIMQSSDQGQTWTDISDGLPPEGRINAATVADGQLIVGYDKSNLYMRGNAAPHPWIKSSMNCRAFSLVPEDRLFFTSIYPTSTAVYIYVIHEGLYKKRHGMAAWEELGTPMGLFSVNDIQEDEAGNVYLACHSGLYFSADGGLTWEARSNFGWVLDLQWQAGTLIASGQGGIYSTDNQGHHWRALSTPLDAGFEGLAVDDFAYDLKPTSRGIVAIRSRTPEDKGVAGKVQLSTDGGHTWQLHPADAYLKDLEDITSVIFHQGRIYCSYQGGVICSKDNGQTWDTLLRYDTPKEGMSLQLDVLGDVLYCMEVAMGC
ncbi:MAG: hypothetical protein R2795_25675 [Saprospiraceae bacterium]